MGRVINTVLAVTIFVTGCASVGDGAEKPSGRAAGAGAITYEAPADAKLGAVVRAIGAQAGGFVLMQGLEWREAGQLKLEKASPAEAAAQLAALAGGEVQASQGYYFMYTSGYEQLEHVSAGGALPAALQPLNAAIAFGAGTHLYTVLAVLSKTLATTIVADNAIAEAQCGEIVLPELPLATVLEAVLKSARIPNEAVDVVAGDNFAFLRSHNLPQRPETLLDTGPLPEQAAALLDRPVNVELPRPQAKTEMFPGAVPLEEALPWLSRQVGVQVLCEPTVARLPVNPAVFTDIPLRAVMDLLIRQWLVPQYGYTVEEGRIVIREAIGE